MLPSFRRQSWCTSAAGNVYPTLIRKEATRPLRVYPQDGEANLDNEWGNWWLANLQMAALTYRSYDHRLVGGTGGHTGEHGGVILPDALRWVWRTTPA